MDTTMNRRIRKKKQKQWEQQQARIEQAIVNLFGTCRGSAAGLLAALGGGTAQSKFVAERHAPL